MTDMLKIKESTRQKLRGETQTFLQTRKKGHLVVKKILEEKHVLTGMGPLFLMGNATYRMPTLARRVLVVMGYLELAELSHVRCHLALTL